MLHLWSSYGLPLSIYSDNVLDQNGIFVDGFNIYDEGHMVFGSANHRVLDFDHGDTDDPTWFIHSRQSPDVDNTQWLSLSYSSDTDRGIIDSGSDELLLDLNTTVGGTLDVTGLTVIGDDTTGIIGTVSGVGDLYIDHEFQVTGSAYFIGSTGWYDSGNAKYYGSIQRIVDDGLHFGIGEDDNYANRHLIFLDRADISKQTHHNTLSANPTIFGHSATDPDSDATQWWSLTHDQSDMVIDVGKGDVKIDTNCVVTGTLDVTGNLDVGGNLTGIPMTIVMTTDGGGSAIETGAKGFIYIPYDCTLTGWDMVVDTSGSIVIDVWVDTYVNYPPTNADTITNGHEPTITTAVKNTDADISDWSAVTLTAGSYIRWNVDSVTDVTMVVLTLKGTR